MKLPKSWNEITVNQFIELKMTNEADLGSLFLYNLELLSIATDEPIEDFEDLSLEEVTLLWNQLTWMRTEPTVKHGCSIEPCSKLTLGQFIDLENYCADNYIKNFEKIIELRSGLNDIGEQPITNYYGVLVEYLEWREKFTNSYASLFAEPLTDEELEDDVEDEPISNKWAWEQLVYQLSNGDITKADAVFELPVVWVFNWLAMKNELKL